MTMLGSHSTLEGGRELFWKQQGRKLKTASSKIFITTHPMQAKEVEETRKLKKPSMNERKRLLKR